MEPRWDLVAGDLGPADELGVQASVRDPLDSRLVVL